MKPITERQINVFIIPFQNLFSIINELRDPSQARIDSVIISSISTAFTVFLIVGIAGYTTYGSFVASDLLKSYPGLKSCLISSEIEIVV